MAIDSIVYEFKSIITAAIIGSLCVDAHLVTVTIQHITFVYICEKNKEGCVLPEMIAQKVLDGYSNIMLHMKWHPSIILNLGWSLLLENCSIPDTTEPDKVDGINILCS